MKKWLNKHQKTLRQLEMILIVSIIVNGISIWILHSIGWIGIKEDDTIELTDGAWQALQEGAEILNEAYPETSSSKESAPLVNNDNTTTEEIEIRVKDEDHEQVALATESGENVVLSCPEGWHYKSASYIDLLKQTSGNEEITAPDIIVYCNSEEFLQATQYLIAAPISQTDKLTRFLSGEDADVSQSHSYAYYYFTTGEQPSDDTHKITELGPLMQGDDIYQCYMQEYKEAEETHYIVSAFGPQKDPVEIIVYCNEESDSDVYMDVLRQTLTGTKGDAQ